MQSNGLASHGPGVSSQLVPSGKLTMLNYQRVHDQVQVPHCCCSPTGKVEENVMKRTDFQFWVLGQCSNTNCFLCGKQRDTKKEKQLGCHISTNHVIIPSSEYHIPPKVNESIGSHTCIWLVLWSMFYFL